MNVSCSSVDTHLGPSAQPLNCVRLFGSSVHGISQARILEWVAIFFSNLGPSSHSKVSKETRIGTKISENDKPSSSTMQRSLSPACLNLSILLRVKAISHAGESFLFYFNVLTMLYGMWDLSSLMRRSPLTLHPTTDFTHTHTNRHLDSQTSFLASPSSGFSLP